MSRRATDIAGSRSVRSSLRDQTVRILSAHIKGFRAIADLEVAFDDLTAFVGTGGVGKSTILNALDWFFAGGLLDERDLHIPADGHAPVESVVVAITFGALTKLTVRCSVATALAPRQR